MKSKIKTKKISCKKRNIKKNNKLGNFVRGIFITLVSVSIIFAAVNAAPPASPYRPGATLAPTCAPGDTNCTVISPAISGDNDDITSLTSGNIGIGTSSAEALLTIQATSTTDLLNLFETGGEEIFTILENGNVGVGTTSPDMLLTLQQSADSQGIKLYGYDDNESISGDMYLDSSGYLNLDATNWGILKESGTGEFYWSSTVFRANDENLITFGTESDFGIGYSDGEDYLQFVDSSTLGSNVRMVISSSGNVGIGTTSPLSLFSLQGTEGSSNIFTIASSTGANLITVDKSGNVGIGTATPSSKLHINGNILIEGIATTTNQGIFTYSPQVAGASNTNKSSVYINPQSSVADSNLLAVADNGTWKFRVDKEGDVFIQGNLTSSGTVSQATTDIAGDFTVEGYSFLGDAPNNDYVNIKGYLALAATSTQTALTVVQGGAGDIINVFDDYGTEVFTVLDGGNVGIGTSTPNALLDIESGNIELTNGYGIGTYGNAASLALLDDMIGIGTTTPQGLLTVHSGQFTIPQGSVGSPSLSFNDDLDTGIYSNSSNQIAIAIAGVAKHNFTSTAFRSPNGTTPLPSHSFIEDSDTGFYRAAANELSFVTAGSGRIYIDSSGNVGIGITEPSQKLHVEGQCITGDSLLPVIDQKNFQFSVFNNLILKPIKDVKAGDYVLSLNEKNGELEPMRINGLLDMGVKPVFKLTTESGKTIRTTGNHPYFIKFQNNQKTISEKMAYGRLTGTSAGIVNLDYSITDINNLSSVSLPKDVEMPGVEPGKHGLTIPASQPAIPTSNLLYQEEFDVSRGKWMKVIYLKEGMQIAVVSKDGKSAVWEEIKNIEQMTAEQVYDIEVDGTHNFVANGIIAHNTYISGNTGIGTTTPPALLTLNDPAGTDSFYIGSSTPKFIVKDSGNVGIGTAAPGETLEVNGTVSIGGSYLDINGGQLRMDGYDDRISAVNHDLKFFLNSVQEVTFKDGGNVGIGTTTPVAMLSVRSSGTTDLLNLVETDGTEVVTVLENGNVGIGTASPSKPLTVNHTTINDVLRLASGDATVGLLFDDPSAQFAGIFSTADNLQLYTNGDTTQGIRIDTAGNVGIGTTSPVAMLSVRSSGTTDLLNLVETDGTEVFTVLESGYVGIGTSVPAGQLEISRPTNGNVDVYLDAPGGNSSTIYLKSAGVSKAKVQYRAQNAGLVLGHAESGIGAAVTQFVIKEGLIGIGTTTPVAMLSVRSSGTTDLLNLVETDGTEVFTVLENGNVGIGTASPGELLHLGDGTAETLIKFQGDNNLNRGLDFYLADGTSLRGYMRLDSNEDLRLKGDEVRIDTGGGIDKLVVDNSGNVGIGTTTPPALLTLNDPAGTDSFYIGSSTPKFIVKDSGNVGIGTAAPGAKLEIYDSSEYAELDVHSDTKGALLDLDRFSNSWDSKVVFRTSGSTSFEIGVDSTPSDKFKIGTSNDVAEFVMDSSGNVGIGTTSPSSILHVNGGTASLATGLSFGDGDTGIYENSDDNLAIDVGGYNRVMLTSTYFYGASGGSPITGSFSLNRNEGTEATPTYTFGDDEDTGIYRSSANTIGFSVNASEAVRIDSSGNVGIGTTSPVAMLTVRSSGTTDLLNLVETDGTEVFTVLENGNVGIGTASPGKKLDIQGTGTQIIKVKSTDADSGNAEVYIDGYKTSNGDVGLIRFANNGTEIANIHTERDGNDAQGKLIFATKTGGTTAARLSIDHTGKVGIGTDSPDYTLQVDGDICPETNKSSDLGKSGLVWDNIYYDDAINEGAAAFTDRIVTEEIVKYPPMPKESNMHDYMTERGLVELNPESLPEDLRHDFSLLSDEMTTYNYKANYEQQLQINTLRNILKIDNKGNIGIGTTSPQYLFTVDGDMQVFQGGLCVADGTWTCPADPTDGMIYAENTSISEIDLAENYPTKEEDLDAGELVSIDLENTEYVKRSTTTYETNLIGVVSTKPGILLGGNCFGEDCAAQAPIALAGRVPVKVNLDNGAIKIGDPLTSASSTPGYAMRATETGKIIGYALEAFNGGFNSSEGLVITFIQPGYYMNLSNNEIDIPSISSYVMSAINDLGIMIKDGIVYIKELIVDKITTKELCIDDVCINRDQLQELLDKNSVSPSNNQSSGQSNNNVNNQEEEALAENNEEEIVEDNTASSTEEVLEDNTASSTEEILEDEQGDESIPAVIQEILESVLASSTEEILEEVIASSTEEVLIDNTEPSAEEVLENEEEVLGEEEIVAVEEEAVVEEESLDASEEIFVEDESGEEE